MERTADAGIIGAGVMGTAPLSVTFICTSTGSITAYQWDFGDGTTSSAIAPTHTYPTPGSYSVSLTVSGAGGSDTQTRAGLITVSSDATGHR